MQSKKFLLPLLAGALALGACDDLGTGSSSDRARVSILLTDAPAQLRTAVVTITDVYLQPSEGEDAERVYLRRGNPVTTNLLELSNDVLELVDETVVPAGTYEQMRFVITGAYIEVEENGASRFYATSSDYEPLPDGVQAGELKCPSCAQSGFKVLLNPGEGDEGDGAVSLDEGEHTLLVDFDVSQSFGHQAGQSGKWILRPTLKATSVQRAATLAVSLSKAADLTLPSLNGTPITLGALRVKLTPVNGTEAKTLDLTDADGNGVYENTFRYLFPGDYAVSFVVPEGVSFGFDLAALSFPVTLGEGQNTSLAFNLTATALTQQP